MTDGPPPPASSTLNWEWYHSKLARNAQITSSHFRINAWLWQRDAADLWVNPKWRLLFSIKPMSVIYHIYIYTDSPLPILQLKAVSDASRRGWAENSQSHLTLHTYSGFQLCKANIIYRYLYVLVTSLWNNECAGESSFEFTVQTERWCFYLSACPSVSVFIRNISRMYSHIWLICGWQSSQCKDHCIHIWSGARSGMSATINCFVAIFSKYYAAFVEKFEGSLPLWIKYGMIFGKQE